MPTIADLDALINGMVERGKQLREQERLFEKIQAWDEAIEEANSEKSDLEKKLADANAELKELKANKTEVLKSSFDTIVEKMNKVLPAGTAVIEYNDDDVMSKKGLYIGWFVDGKHEPYNGLSGMEKQVFDAAISVALNGDLIALEAAELSDAYLLAFLEDSKDSDKQILICTCHDPGKIPKAFTKVEVCAA